MSTYISSAARRKADMPSMRWVGFEMNGQAFGVRIDQVREVLSTASIEPVPGAPKLVLGVINLRGRVVSVLDLHMCLGMERKSPEEPRIIIVELEGEPIALRVDRITDLAAVSDNAIKPAPAMGTSGTDAGVCGVVSRDNFMLTLLDLDRLLKAIA